MRLLLLAALLASPAAAETLTVDVTGAKPGGGQIVVALWKAADGFGSFALGKAMAVRRAPLAGEGATVSFEGVAPGSYAVSAFHDTDRDGKLKTNFIGIPREGVAVSNNPGGIPRFAKSLIPVKGATRTRIVMRYL